MSNMNNFNDIDEAIDFIINQLSDEERELIKSSDPIGIQFALSKWIRTGFIIEGKNNLNELIHDKIKSEDPYYRENPDVPLVIHPDNACGFIIGELIKKLKHQQEPDVTQPLLESVEQSSDNQD